MGVAKRLAMRLDRVASFNTVSEHTTLFEELHDKAAHLAGAAATCRPAACAGDRHRGGRRVAQRHNERSPATTVPGHV